MSKHVEAHQPKGNATQESPVPSHPGKPKQYKPFVLWTATLSVLLVVTLILFGIVELACQKLPHAENHGLVANLRNGSAILDEIDPRKHLNARIITFTPTELEGIATPTPDPPVNNDPTPAPDPVDPKTTIYSTSYSLVTISDLEYTVEYQLTSVFGQFTQAPKGGYWAQIGVKTLPRAIVSPTPNPIPDPVNPNPNTPVPQNPDPASPSPINNVPSNPNPTPVSPNTNSVIPLPVPVPVDPSPGSTLASNPVQTNVNSAISNTVKSLPANPNPSVQTQQPANGIPSTARQTGPTATAASTFTPVAFIPVATTIRDAAGNVKVTTASVAVDSAGSTLAFSTGQISTDATRTVVVVPTATSNGQNDHANESDTIVHVFTNRDYITGAFLPTVLAVLFAIPWALIDAAAKEMEPFYQMATIGGAPVANSIVLNYATTSMFVAPFLAFNRRHWIIFLTSILGLLSLFLAPIAVEAVFISLQGVCNAETMGVYCLPTLSVFKPAARVLEALLLSMAALLALLMYLNHKRSSNVLAEPISLAGVASLMHNQEFLNIVRDVPSHGVQEKDLISTLPIANFTIGHYQNSDGSWGYGFMVSRDLSSPNVFYTGNPYSNVNMDDASLEAKGPSFWSRFLRLAQVVVFLVFLIGILAIIAYYRFDEGEINNFGRFMNTQQFGPKFLFTTLGVIVSQFWGYAREKIHRNEPYHSLATHASPPRKSILKSPALAPITSVFTSIRLLSPLLILIDLSTIFADALIITLANVPFSSATTYEAFKICSAISLFILAFMIVTIVYVLVRIGRFGAAEGGGEVPVTVVGKAVLMCGSGMLERFDGLGETDGKDRNKRVESWGKVYGIGRVRGVDGVVRRGIDFGEYVEGH